MSQPALAVLHISFDHNQTEGELTFTICIVLGTVSPAIGAATPTLDCARAYVQCAKLTQT